METEVNFRRDFQMQILIFQKKMISKIFLFTLSATGKAAFRRSFVDDLNIHESIN